MKGVIADKASLAYHPQAGKGEQMSRRLALVILAILVVAVISFGSFKYGELQSGEKNAERHLHNKLTAAFAIQSVKLLLNAEEGMTEGELRKSREALITHLGDSLYFVGKGLSRNESAYKDIAASLCPRRPHISGIITTLPEEKSTDDANVRANQRARRKLFMEGLAEIEKHCSAEGKQ